MSHFSHIKSLILSFVLIVPSIAFAVTQKEMEEARTIATKAYLRYANDGSGYLDEVSATTMEELEAQLKPKEKENIKAFKEIPVPSDYKQWDKDKLLQYWAVTAFQNSNLLEKGRGGRLRARTQINKMTVSAPEAAPAPTADSVSTTPVAEPEQPAPVVETPIQQADASNEYADLNMTEIHNQEDSILATEEEFVYDNSSLEKATNNSWVYIMILCILVAIVIALVVYAANVMKKNNKKMSEAQAHDPHISEKLEHYENTVGEKQNEILMLSKKLESANRQNNELRSKLETLSAELSTMRNNPASNSGNPKQSPVTHTQHNTETTRHPSVRTIFLGRANAKGIFVRADRSLNIGNSIFVLETSDGFSGTFKVADSPAAWGLAFSNPREYLDTACTGSDLDNTSSASKIITEQSGTAVFEDGCWRVIRKARISYE